MLNTFKFQINENITDTMRYYVDMAGWDVGSVNVAHAMMDHPLSENMFGENQGYSSNKSLLKHDLIRFSSQETYNSYKLTSLIANADQIMEELVQLGHLESENINSIFENISLIGNNQDLVDLDGTGLNQYLTNSNLTDTNFVRNILQKIQLEEPDRFTAISNIDSIQSVPFQVNDQIVYINTFNLNGIAPRVYLIRLVIVADENVSNTVVQDSVSYPLDYPYAV